jgi:hypothetical protein
VSVYTHPLQDDEPFLLHKDFGKVRVLRLFRQLFVAAVRVVASGQQQWEMMCCAWDVVRVSCACVRAPTYLTPRYKLKHSGHRMTGMERGKNVNVQWK